MPTTAPGPSTRPIRRAATARLRLRSDGPPRPAGRSPRRHLRCCQGPSLTAGPTTWRRWAMRGRDRAATSGAFGAHQRGPHERTVTNRLARSAGRPSGRPLFLPGAQAAARAPPCPGTLRGPNYSFPSTAGAGSSFPSTAGASLRSLAYAPFGAAREVNHFPPAGAAPLACLTPIRRARAVAPSGLLIVRS